jgi:hypothetical protein
VVEMDSSDREQGLVSDSYEHDSEFKIWVSHRGVYEEAYHLVYDTV